MLDAADVLVDRHPVLGRRAVEHARARSAASSSGGSTTTTRRRCPSCRSRAAPGRRSAGTRVCTKLGDLGERRAALAADLHVLGQHDRQALLALRHHAARRAVEDGDRRAPVALAADAPVAQAVVDLGPPEPLRHEPVDRLALGLRDTEPVEEARVDLDAVARVRLGLLPVRRPLHRRDDRQPVLRGEVPVALVLARHRHDRAGAVAHQHVVGEEERDLLRR